MARRTKEKRLLPTQGCHGVSLHCGACRNECGRESHQGQQHGDSDVAGWIVGADAEEQALKHARQQERSDESDCAAQCDEAEAFAQDEPQDVETAGAEGHAHTDFLGALHGHEGDDAIESDDGHGEAGAGEEAQQRGFEARAISKFAHRLGQRFDFDRSDRIDLRDLRLHPRGNDRSRERSFKQQYGVPAPILCAVAAKRLVLGVVFASEAGVLHVACDADDGVAGAAQSKVGVECSAQNMLPDGVFAGKHARGKQLAEDHEVVA